MCFLYLNEFIFAQITMQKQKWGVGIGLSWAERTINVGDSLADPEERQKLGIFIFVLEEQLEMRKFGGEEGEVTPQLLYFLFFAVFFSFLLSFSCAVTFTKSRTAFFLFLLSNRGCHLSSGCYIRIYKLCLIYEPLSRHFLQFI